MSLSLSTGLLHLQQNYQVMHHSMVVEQANGYVLVEAPLDPFRTLAITGWAANQMLTL